MSRPNRNLAPDPSRGNSQLKAFERGSACPIGHRSGPGGKAFSQFEHLSKDWRFFSPRIERLVENVHLRGPRVLAEFLRELADKCGLEVETESLLVQYAGI